GVVIRAPDHLARERGWPAAAPADGGRVGLKCRRCRQPRGRSLEGGSHIARIDWEDEGGRAPAEREPVLAPGGRMSIGELLTEELLLLLPIVPLHEERECGGKAAAADRAAPGGATHPPVGQPRGPVKR